MSQVPEHLRYRESHEWIDPQSGAVGITDHAQHELTAIAFVELPVAGMTVKAGDHVATVESVKVASEIYAPVSGEITEINESLLEVNNNPPADYISPINKDPYGEGWIFKIKISDAAEVDSLMDAAAYAQHNP